MRHEIVSPFRVCLPLVPPSGSGCPAAFGYLFAHLLHVCMESGREDHHTPPFPIIFFIVTIMSHETEFNKCVCESGLRHFVIQESGERGEELSKRQRNSCACVSDGHEHVY